MSFIELVAQATRAFRYPEKTYSFIKRKLKEIFFWDFYYNAIREPKIKHAVPTSRQIHHKIIDELKKNNFNIVTLKVDINDYNEYVKNGEYHKNLTYYRGRLKKQLPEKTLEHYLAAKLLGLSQKDIYIDIANNNSPAPEIYQKLYGCKAYKQDLIFPKGIKGSVIGGEAGNMPVEDGFATKMAVHDALQCFEQDGDIRFIKEAARVLQKGGKLCVVPLHLFTEYVVATDPATLSNKSNFFEFEKDTKLYCVKGLGYRFNRHYDVPQLIQRIKNNLNELKLTIYVIQNEQEIAPTCYVKFVAMFEK